jgi:hypothetical protein
MERGAEVGGLWVEEEVRRRAWQRQAYDPYLK